MFTSCFGLSDSYILKGSRDPMQRPPLHGSVTVNHSYLSKVANGCAIKIQNVLKEIKEYNNY